MKLGMLYFFGFMRQRNDSCRKPLRPVMSRPNLNLNDFMGVFRTGFLACLVLGWTTFAQQPPPGGPAPIPGVIPDTNAPVVPQPDPTQVDPSLVQPAPIPADTTIPPEATPQKKVKKPAVAALPTLRGSVASIDTTNMTIVVHGKSKDETLSITSKTRIFADTKPAILSDAKQGENVIAEYRNTKEKTKEALTLRFLGGHAAPAAKAEVKPAVKKATKAAAKKKKPATKTEPKPEDTGAIVTPLPDTNAPVANPNPGVVPAPQPGTPPPGTPVPNP
jgi:hypothetical protein